MKAFYHHKEGLSFRHLEETDLTVLMELRSDSWTTTHSMTIPTKAHQLKWFDELQQSTDKMILVAMDESKRELGIATYYNIDHFNKNLLIGGHVFPSYQKQGFTTKGWAAGMDFAFEVMGMQRVYAEVLATNTAALKIDTKYLGMIHEGVKRKHVYKCGKWIDSIMLGLLREEWENLDRIKGYGGSCNKDITA